MKSKILKKIILISVICFLLIFFMLAICRTGIIKVENWSNSNFFMSEEIDFKIESPSVIYDDFCELKLYVNQDEKDALIKVLYNDQCSEYTITGSEITVPLKNLNEGKNNVKIVVTKEENQIYSEEKSIYYIKPYVEQFNDKSEKNGVVVHYRDSNPNYEDVDQSINQLDSLGIQYIRTDFLQSSILNQTTGEYNFDKYDNWINKIISKNSNIKIVAIIDGIFKHGGNRIIDSDEEVDEYVDFVEDIYKKYPQIKYFQVLNEPNSYATWKINYNNVNDIQWYSKIYEKLFKKNNLKDKILTSGTETPDSENENKITSLRFYNEFSRMGGLNYINNISFHPYAFNDLYRLKLIINDHRKYSNENGGFNYLNITEYGSTIRYLTEEKQAFDLVKQSVFLDSRNINLKILYNLWTTSNNSNSLEQFGLLRNDYTPRPSYYSMKKYYENTNGSEYIGYIQNSELTFHVYDKDGVPLVVCWSNDNSKTIEIPYSGFTAYDLYGNEIENTDGKLSITSSPVYLKNADRSYFYRAISNTAVSAYDEFLTNYSDYLDSSDEMIAVKNEVNKMKKYAEGLANGGEVSEAEALSKMKEHFAIGDMILKAYKDEKLSCEYVKLSSMLDQLNTIGYAFEDLVTITAKDVSNANLMATEKIMNTFDNKASANVSVEMVYPNKIKAFAKDYYDTSSYINGLEEENPIKNGLIIGKGLHAYYLAGWADSFADCYLETPEITIQYSNTELTNEDVVVTLESNVPIEMEGSNQYTFTENGSFTFKYTLYGEPKEITAVVDWIDKDAPVISGIDEREDETEHVTLNVTDANLDTITVTKDGQDVSFSNGDILIEKGEYEVVAKDRAENSSERPFKIVDYIESNKIYYVSPDGTGDGSSEDLPMSAKDLNKLKLYAGDKILLKSGEKYSVNIECKRKGSPDNRVVISNYGEGALPVINGSLDLVSNLKISNLRFTNNAESCLVTNYDYCENVKIENCIFDNVADSAIYLNRQVSNFEITNCIFKNCKNAGITMKNDSQNLMVNSVKITNNIFVNLTKSIDIASEVADNTFENVEIGENYFIVQTSDEAVIKVGKIVTDKFEVSVYSNLFYSFSRAYEVFDDSLNDIKGHLLCDYNTFYAYKESKYLNDISDIKTLGDEYGNEANSNVTVIDREKYDVYDCLNTTLKLDDKEQILSNLTEKIDVGNRRMQVDVVGSPDRIIKNKVMGLEEMKTSDIEEITDSSVADEVLPLAGWQKVSIAIISIIVITGLFSAGKYSKYKKDTKKQIRRK